jgi:PAS domain S-box-containing protein
MSEDNLERLSRMVEQDKLDDALWLSICPDTWELSQDAQIVFDKCGRVFRANRKSRLMLGYSHRQLRCMTAEDLMPERFRQKHHEHREAYVKDPMPRFMGEDLELWLLTADGEEIAVAISLSPLESERGIFINTVIRKRRDKGRG